jgi:hypothetical protein
MLTKLTRSLPVLSKVEVSLPKGCTLATVYFLLSTNLRRTM